MRLLIAALMFCLAGCVAHRIDFNDNLPEHDSEDKAAITVIIIDTTPPNEICGMPLLPHK